MSQGPQSRDIIPANTWPLVRAMHAETRGVDLVTVFGTRLRGQTIEAYLSHKAIDPRMYDVLCPPVDEEEHRKLFGIAISQDEEFGQLRVHRMADSPSQTIDRESRRIQGELGLDIPNPQDFRDFHEVIVNSFMKDYQA